MISQPPSLLPLLSVERTMSKCNIARCVSARNVNDLLINFFISSLYRRASCETANYYHKHTSFFLFFRAIQIHKKRWLVWGLRHDKGHNSPLISLESGAEVAQTWTKRQDRSCPWHAGKGGQSSGYKIQGETNLGGGRYAR